MQNIQMSEKCGLTRDLSPMPLLQFRVLALSWVFVHWALACYDSGYPDFFVNMLKYLTYWGMQLTIVYFACGVFLSQRDTEYSSYFDALNQIVFVNNSMIVMFYFAFLYIEGPLDLTQYLAIENHSMPFILILVDTLLNRNVFKWKRYFIYYALMSVYFICNLAFTFLDKPVYPTLDYKDLHSVLFVGTAFLLSLLGHAIGMFIKNMINPKSREFYNKNLNVNLKDSQKENNLEKVDENEFA